MKSRFRRIWPLVLPVAAVAFLCCLGLLFWASQHGWLSYLARIRILMGMVSGLVLLVTLESLRRYHLRERYAILWMVTGLLILLTAIFPEALDRGSREDGDGLVEQGVDLGLAGDLVGAEPGALRQRLTTFLEDQRLLELGDHSLPDLGEASGLGAQHGPGILYGPPCQVPRALPPGLGTVAGALPEVGARGRTFLGLG